jgi:hypothetical protein
MEVFIVRPFGKKNVFEIVKGPKKSIEVEYDFDLVETNLIKPAMKALNLTGGTTGEIFEAGEIREDMFSALLLADIVIADISIYNANVFYELGIRHALRDKVTILIKSRGFDNTPFDLIGYRYISYERTKPEASLEDLLKAIGESINAGRKDSPVFNLLPRLESQDPEKYIALPLDFTNEVTLAKETRSVGKLALLAEEVNDFSWKYAALRRIGNALFDLKAFTLVKTIWEQILEYKPEDILAIDRLATIYQRLADKESKINMIGAVAFYTRSDMTITKLLNNSDLVNYQRAEAYALRARNAKARWINAWRSKAQQDWGSSAISSPLLVMAYENYFQGFSEDQNHFYSGLNALGLLMIIIHLAEAYPEEWELLFDTAEKAAQNLRMYKEEVRNLSITICSSIKAAQFRLKTQNKTDEWVEVSEADYLCLTSDKPLKVAAKYKQVMEVATALNAEAISRQLIVYQQLGIRIENIEAALGSFSHSAIQKVQSHYILFTGHMIDRVDRKTPRFPATKEATAREMIKAKITEIRNKLPEDTLLIGVAGGACGGDMLFHELCIEMGIHSILYLALPKEQFVVESVSFAGPEWIDRFYKLCRTLPNSYLMDAKTLPNWLHKKKNYDIWVRNNIWLLKNAMVEGGEHLSFIALWNGGGGDGPGGTEHMVRAAAAIGAKNYIIDSNKLVIPAVERN